jgi:hypothetical protein
LITLFHSYCDKGWLAEKLNRSTRPLATDGQPISSKGKSMWIEHNEINTTFIVFDMTQLRQAAGHRRLLP